MARKKRNKKHIAKQTLCLYICQVCAARIIAAEIHKGFTPIGLPCRADNCTGLMVKNPFPPAPESIAKFEFYRPDNFKQLDEETLAYLETGGLLMRPRVVSNPRPFGLKTIAETDIPTTRTVRVNKVDYVFAEPSAESLANYLETGILPPEVIAGLKQHPPLQPHIKLAVIRKFLESYK